MRRPSLLGRLQAPALAFALVGVSCSHAESGKSLSTGAEHAAAPVAATTLTEATTWSSVEPVLRARFALLQQGEYFTTTTEAPLTESMGTPAIRAAVVDVTARDGADRAMALRRCSLGLDAARKHAMPLVADHGLDAATSAYRARILDDPRTERILRGALARQLATRGVSCADCDVPPPAPRAVRFADLTPYLSRFVALSARDLERATAERVSFHICSGLNGMAGLEPIDMDLAATALSAMFRASAEAKASVELAGDHVIAVWRAQRGDPTAERASAINSEVWRRLASDTKFLDELRPLVADEARVSGLACADCAAAP